MEPQLKRRGKKKREKPTKRLFSMNSSRPSAVILKLSQKSVNNFSLPQGELARLERFCKQPK